MPALTESVLVLGDESVLYRGRYAIIEEESVDGWETCEFMGSPVFDTVFRIVSEWSNGLLRNSSASAPLDRPRAPNRTIVSESMPSSCLSRDMKGNYNGVEGDD
jgi:hypothetical protein